MVSKRQIRQAIKTGEPIEVWIEDKCIICNKGDYGDILLVKIPECISVCLDCAEKYPDNKVYGGLKGGWAMWRIL